MLCLGLLSVTVRFAPPQALSRAVAAVLAEIRGAAAICYIQERTAPPAVIVTWPKD